MRWIAALHSVLLVLVLLPSAARASVEGRRIEQTGSGELPHDADQLTYRIDFAWKHEPAERVEVTVRGSELPLNDEYRADLLAMRVGEVRRVWGHGVDGNWCDHFGCAPPQPFSARLELVSVARHHDPLPGDLRIAAHPLRVIDGTTAAELPGDDASTIRAVRLNNDIVSIEVTYEPGTRVAIVTFALDELRARVLDKRAMLAFAQGNTRTAMALLDQALALSPNLDEASVHRAAVLLRREGPAAANAALHDVAVTNPVWLAWKLLADRSLAPLRTLPVVREHEKPNGEVDSGAVQEHTLVVLAEPTGEFLAVHVTPTYGGEVMRIIHRASGEIVASIPVRCEGPVDYSEAGLNRCASVSLGARVLQRLGFAPVAEASTSGDPQVLSFDNLRIFRWIQEQGRASDITVEPAPARMIASASETPVTGERLPTSRAETCRASESRLATSDEARRRNVDALAVLALIALVMLGDIAVWRLGLAATHAR